MQEKIVKIRNQLGLHARAAARLVQLTNRYQSSVHVIKNDQEVDAKSIMGLLTLAAEKDSSLTIIVEGEDEKELLDELIKLIENKFYEE